MVAFWTTLQKFHWLFSVGSLDSETVRIFLKRICIASQEKENKNFIYIFLANEEVEAATFDSW